MWCKDPRDLTKKEVYIMLSFVLLVFVIGTLLNDAVHVMVIKNTENTSQQYTVAVLLVHAVAFYLGLLGFVYVTQTVGYATATAWSALASVIINTTVFAFRVAFELTYTGYRRESYHG